MNTNPSKATLNRPVFAQSRFDSSALTVLAAWFHRFEDPGTYEATIRRNGRTVGRRTVNVAADSTERQHNVDMASLNEEAPEGCACRETGALNLARHGVLGFYVSRGTGRYEVTIVRYGEKGKVEVAASGETLPAGDLFSLTLARPGSYTVHVGDRENAGRIRVAMPGPVGYDPGRSVVVELDESYGLDETVEIEAGQSVVFLLRGAARIRAELIEPKESSGPIRGSRTKNRRKPGTGSGAA